MSPAPVLFSHEVIAAAATGRLPAWAGETCAAFCDDLRAPGFPCLFGTAALNEGQLRFVAVGRPSREEDLWRLHHGLAYFLVHCRRDTLASLVALFEPDIACYPLEAYEHIFWGILQWLHTHDDHPWPTAIPTQPNHPDWEFCFAGEPIFVVCNTPAHRQRRSRRSLGLAIAFQPRWVFEQIGLATPRGAKARDVIRARLCAYDGQPPHPALGAYGDAQNREWQQYFLPDDNQGETHKESCPLQIRR